jgi:CRP-like cAMP-binding protein
MSAYDMPPACKQHVPFFILDNPSLGSRATYLAEESIYCDGDRTEHWYGVISGGVRACKLLPDGRRQVIEFYLPGDQFGFDDLDGFHTLSAEAVAVQRTVLPRHNRRRLNAKAASDPALAIRIRDIMLRSLMQTRRHLMILGRLKALERVASFLLEMDTRLAEQPDHGAADSFSLPMDRKDIANHLGVTHETLSRCIQTLRRSGTITFPSQRQVRIRDRAALTTMSGGAAALPLLATEHPAKKPWRRSVSLSARSRTMPAA